MNFDLNSDFESLSNFDISIFIFTGIVTFISTLYFINYMYNWNNKTDDGDDGENENSKQRIIYSLVGLFEVVKYNTDSDGNIHEEKYFSIGNFINLRPNIFNSASDYITFIAGFLKNDFKFNKFRIVAISYNNGAFNEIKTSVEQKDLLNPTMAYFKAFNTPHYYMKIKLDTRIIDIFRDVFPAVICQNKQIIADLLQDNTDSENIAIPE